MEPETDYEIRQPILHRSVDPQGEIQSMLVGKPLASFEVPGCLHLTQAEAVCINGVWYAKAPDQGYWHDRWRRR